MLELEGRDDTADLESDWISRFSIEKEIPRGFIVCEDGHLMTGPGRAPDLEGEGEGEELEEGDVPVQHVGGDPGGEVLVGGEIESANSRLILEPTIAGGVQGDVSRVGELEERLPVPGPQVGVPPQEVQLELDVEPDRLVVEVGGPLRLQHSGQVDTTWGNDLGAVQELTTQGVEFGPAGEGSCQPLQDQGGDGDQLVLWEGNDVGQQVVLHTQRDADESWGADVTGGGGGL